MQMKTTMVLVTGMAAGAASADVADNLIQIRAMTDSGEYNWALSSDDARIVRDGDTIRFNFNGGPDNAIIVLDGEGGIAFALRTLNIDVTADTASRGATGEQRVNVGFDLVAGSQNSTFVVDSAFLSFAQIDNAAAQASASVSVTDLGSGSATLSPIGGGMYNAHVNGQAPGGTQVASLLNNPLTATGVFGSNTATEDFGAGGFVSLGQSVSSISSQFAFSLSAGDLGSGTSTFVVIPAPASIALFGLGAVATIRRR